MLYKIFFNIIASVSVGYIAHLALYWHEMHATVDLENDVCSGIDLIISLAVSGFVLALL